MVRALGMLGETTLTHKLRKTLPPPWNTMWVICLIFPPLCPSLASYATHLNTCFITLNHLLPLLNTPMSMLQTPLKTSHHILPFQAWLNCSLKNSKSLCFQHPIDCRGWDRLSTWCGSYLLGNSGTRPPTRCWVSYNCGNNKIDSSSRDFWSPGMWSIVNMVCVKNPLWILASWDCLGSNLIQRRLWDTSFLFNLFKDLRTAS